MKKTFLLTCLLLATNGFMAVAQHDTGLLFYQSCDTLQANVAAGIAAPNYAYAVSVIPDGAHGNAFRCGEEQLLTWWAPGNMYAQRGTLSFYWRAGADPYMETEYPLFRVAYADHSSPDMMWLRIDYNGHGYDAFVTDANLARIRISTDMPLPDAMQWTHFALVWDETWGIRFYINGEKVGQRDTTVVLDAALDQFGTHAYLLSPYKVESEYNYRRGGDFDEIRVYDHALGDAEIRKIAQGEDYRPAPFTRSLDVKQWNDEWTFRYGWTGRQLPPALDSRVTTVRKVQIFEAYDWKTWWWKANDGIRETTWPGVYNRSRIIGRTDYFVCPDWFCYSNSGERVRFNMPDEKWNYLEISGGADGPFSITPNNDGSGGKPCFTREKGRERTFHKMETPVTGQTVAFTNNVPETPIGEMDAFFVHKGDAPAGIARLSYKLSSHTSLLSNPNISEVLQYIRGRHPIDEQTVLTAVPHGYANAASQVKQPTVTALPLVHILIPSDFRSMYIHNAGRNALWALPPDQGWHNFHGGLDGIRITLPPMNMAPVAHGLFPLNIQVKDPVWTLRNMLDFSFSMKPNEEQVLWLDLRDRILPNDKPLYLRIAGSAGFHAGMLEGARIELVFKDRNEAKTEHIIDRFTQVRDNYAMLVEETPNERRLTKYVQLENDLTDLLRIDPDHKEGREYWYRYNPSQARPPVYVAPVPAGVPMWAHLQLEYLKKYRYFVEWQIDHRQIDNGEFGGGLSDDSDFTNHLPALALLGVLPDKVDNSLSRMMEAIYNNDMLVNGMSKLQADGLHTYEEGVNAICQLNLLRIGNPKEVERMQEAAYAVKNYLTGVNNAGHTHFRSDYFSATKIVTKGIWAWLRYYECFHLIPAIYLGEFYGNEAARKNVLDIADGLLAHADTLPDGSFRVYYAIHFDTDERRPSGMGIYAPAFWAAWRWTGDGKYLKALTHSMHNVNSNMLDICSMRDSMAQQLTEPDSDFNRFLAWQITGDKKYLESLYREILEAMTLLEYINTEGYIWTDRIGFRTDMLQRSRLGGVCLERMTFYAGNAVSWRFPHDNDAEKIAILVPFSTPKELKLEFFNTEPKPMEVQMTGWDVLNGEWELTQGIDDNGDGKMDNETVRKKVIFGRDENVTLTIPPQKNVLVHLKLSGDGALVTDRPDLGISADDIHIAGNQITVTVHNLGNKPAPATEIALTDRNGQIVQTAVIPALAGVHDLRPQRVQVTLTLPPNVKSDDCRVVIDPKNALAEIRKTNNTVNLK